MLLLLKENKVDSLVDHLLYYYIIAMWNYPVIPYLVLSILMGVVLWVFFDEVLEKNRRVWFVLWFIFMPVVLVLFICLTLFLMIKEFIERISS